MVKQRRPKGLEREQAVVEAAVDAIAELGLDEVRIADVAERAGMSPGHVSYYFGSKTQILMSALRWSEEEFQREVLSEIERVKAPWARLERLFELAAARERGDPGWILWLEVWSLAASDPAVARIHQELDGWWRATLADVIRYGTGKKAFCDVDADRAAMALSALMDGLSTQLVLGTEGMTRADVLELCIAVAHGMLDPSEGNGSWI